MHYTARHPGNVERLIIVDIGPEIAQVGIQNIHARLGPEEFDSVEKAAEYMRSQDALTPEELLQHRAKSSLKQLPTGRWTMKSDPALRDPQSRGRRADPQVLWDLIAGIRCPTMLVRGEVSDLLSPETAQRMVEVMPDATLVEVTGTGHRVVSDNGHGFENAVREFLST